MRLIAPHVLTEAVGAGGVAMAEVTCAIARCDPAETASALDFAEAHAFLRYVSAGGFCVCVCVCVCVCMCVCVFVCVCVCVRI